MIELKNTNTKKEYKYRWTWVKDLSQDELLDIIKGCCSNGHDGKVGNGKKENAILRRIPRKLVGSKKYGKLYLDIPLSFDIETTTKYTKDSDGKCIYSFASMYVWQLGIGENTVLMGNSWHDFIQLIGCIKEILKPRDNMRILCWVHNLNFELSFMRKYLNITDSFLRDTRSPLYVLHDDFIEFRDSMAMTNSTLQKLAKDFTNTQKCDGDLDYTIERNCNDAYNLSDIELGYCHNDVLILIEWARYYYDTYIKVNFAPLTISSVLRNEISTESKKDEYKGIITSVKNAQPSTEEFYNYLVTEVYRGGYSHANIFIVGETFTKSDNIKGFDFTSSYPAVMNLCYFPSRFYKQIPTLEMFNRMINKYCCVFTATFRNIKSTTGHSIESKHKCLHLEGAKIDNGHVREAKVMKVSICELDYYTYCEFYTWDSIEIHTLYCAEKMQLPKYILNPMNFHYTEKDRLKKMHLPYAVPKSKVNTFYGVQITKRPVIETKLTNDGFKLNPVKSFNEWIDKQLLYCAHGVYISAHARRNLLKSVYKMEMNPNNYTPVLYCDTDSIKVLHFDDYCQKVIDDYNEDIKKRLLEVGLTDKVFSDLGYFDYEYGKGSEKGEVLAFKSLGAKRYLITARNEHGIHTTPTIAGCPKNALSNTWGNWIRWYREFRNEMKINDCKLTAIYHDGPTQDIINGQVQNELSSVALVPISFSMSLDDAWCNLIIKNKEDNINLEKRCICENIRKN